MELRRTGAARLPATPLGLGLAALGRPGYIADGRVEDLGADRSPERMEARAHAVLDAAWETGIRYFDVARSYGQAEAFLARWLNARDISAGEVTVASKWGYTYTAAWQLDAEVHETKDHSADNLRSQLAQTRVLLGEMLDVYQVHSATLDTGVLTDAAVLEELAGLRDSGVIVGFTTSGPRQADVVRQGIGAEVGGQRVFGLVQATWNPLETSVGPALGDAADAGLVVVVKEALANGRLTVRGDAGGSGALADVAERRGVTPDVVALAAALAQPWCGVVLSGAATPEQLRANAGAVDLRLGDEDLAALEALAEPAEAYWQARSARAWG